MSRGHVCVLAIVVSLGACEFMGAPTSIRTVGSAGEEETGGASAASGSGGGGTSGSGGNSAGSGGESGEAAGGASGTGTGGGDEGGDGGGPNGGSGTATGGARVTGGNGAGGNGANGGGADLGGAMAGGAGSGGAGSGGAGFGGGGIAGEGGTSGSGGGGVGGAITTPCSRAISGMRCFGAATFSMGAEPYEVPIHQVTVAAFYIDVTEVTTSAYVDCFADGDCALPHNVADSSDCNFGAQDRGDHPINCVTFDQARTYCNAIGKRLPTEEEWDYAAYGGVRYYPWGDAPPGATRLNSCGDECTGGSSAWGDDGFFGTAPVGSYPSGATPEGLLDMAGNVWEAVDSRSCAYPSTPCTSCPTDRQCENSCQCAEDDGNRIARGNGCYDAFTNPDQVGRGHGSGSSGWTPYSGFRCARDAD